jgi:hypothetical protein
MDTPILITTGVVAVTEFLKRVQSKDWQGTAVIIAAAIIGTLAGVYHLDGISITTGLLAGLAAVGIHTVAKQVG